MYRPLSRRLDRCDRVIHNESGDPNGGNMCSFSGATCRGGSGAGSPGGAQQLTGGGVVAQIFRDLE